MRRFSSLLFFRPVMFSLSEGEEEEEEEEIKEREKKELLSSKKTSFGSPIQLWKKDLSCGGGSAFKRRNRFGAKKKTFFLVFSSPCSLGRVRIAMTFCNMFLVVTRRNAVSRKIRHKNDDERNVMGLEGLGRAFKNFMEGLTVGY